MNKSGPWETLVKDQLEDTRGGKAASLLNFTFEQPVEVNFLKFDLISYWGSNGGALQYFAAIPAKSKQHCYLIRKEKSRLQLTVLSQNALTAM